MTPIYWEDSPWKQLSLVNDEEVISLSHAKVYVFSDSVLCLGKVNSWVGSKIHHNNRTLDTIDGESMEFEWKISQDSPYCSLSKKSKSSWTKWANRNNSKDKFCSCRCSMTSHGDLKTINGNAMLTPTSCPKMQKDSHQDDGHSSDLDQKRSGILLTTKDHKENGTESLN